MKILLTGATGLVGKELGKALVEKGHQLIVVSRRADEAQELLPFPCRVIGADLVQGPIEDSSELKGIDVAINLMGEPVGGGRWDASRKKRIQDSRVLGTRHLLESFKVKPKVVISASAIGFYGDCGEEEVTESHEAGSDFLSLVSQNWEEELLPLAFGDSGTRTVCLRTGLVLASQGGALSKLIPLFSSGLGGVLGDGQQWMSWIHISDVVGMIIHTLEQPSIRGPVNLVSPQPVRNEEFTKKFAQVLGVSVGPRVPAMVLKGVMGEMASLVLNSQRVLPIRSRQTGYTFAFTNLEDALRDVCRPYVNGGSYFQQEQFFPYAPEKIFPFFSEAKNLQKITPANLDFKILSAAAAPLKSGDEIRYALKIHGFPVEWVTVIEDWKPPYRFDDRQKKGPYKSWHHTHEFRPMPGGTLMVDKVRYSLPMGKVGDFVAGSFVRKDIESIFSYRRNYLFKNLEREIQQVK